MPPNSTSPSAVVTCSLTHYHPALAKAIKKKKQTRPTAKLPPQVGKSEADKSKDPFLARKNCGIIHFHNIVSIEKVLGVFFCFFHLFLWCKIIIYCNICIFSLKNHFAIGRKF